MLSVAADEQARAELSTDLDELFREGARRMLAAALEAEVEAEIDEAVEYAKNAPMPENEAALHNVFWEG